jgi:polyether ionophore transport system permease protein
MGTAVADASAIARRVFADSRVRTISFALLFILAALTQATAYREGYPTLAERRDFARSVGENDAARMLYGAPHDLLSVGGYVSWRVGGILVVFAALWGLLGAVRAMRAEEEAGRAELLLAGVTSRRKAFLAQLAAIGVGAAVLWLALFVAFLAGKLPAGGSAYLALAIVSVVPVFAGVGAVSSQLAPTKRMATGLAVGVLVLAFALRTVAAISSAGLDWLRWATPLGWAEELRPFADPQPLVLLTPAASAVLLLAAAGTLWVRRDIGSGLLPARDAAPPRLRLLGSPAAQTVRSERGALVAWLVGVGAFALLMGIISDAATPDVISENVQRQLEKLGSGSVVTPSGWLGFSFIFFILAVSLFCCMQIASFRAEEAEQRLETLFALPVGRDSWLAGRLLLAAAGASVVALAAGVFAWAGAAVQGADVSLLEMLGAGANTLPPALLFLGLGVLAFALVPRASTVIVYGLVGLAFVWELFGALWEAPDWLLALSPFHDVGLVPGEPFEAAAAAIMLALASAAALAALWAFRRRDLVGT